MPPPPLAATSSIQRSWKSTFTSLIIACVSAAVSVVLFLTIASGPVTVGIALIPAVLALIFIYSAISGAGEGPCPSCQNNLSGLSTSSNDGVLCPHCLLYHQGDNGQLWPTDPARIADTPLFSSPVPEQFSFPESCCVCGKPPTHRVKVSVTHQNASSAVTQSTIGLTTSTRTTLEVPHCEDHKDGALLTGTPQKPHIKFRSYPYLRAFCETNNTKPG